MIRLESERIYFTAEVANGPVSIVRHRDVLNCALTQPKATEL